MSRKTNSLQAEEEILSLAKKETGSTLALIMTALERALSTRSINIGAYLQ